MATREFSAIQAGGLLADVERIVVDAHRRLTESGGREWSARMAYHWLRYEDPDPVARLEDGVRRLRKRGGSFDSSAVDKACAKAAEKGFSN